MLSKQYHFLRLYLRVAQSHVTRLDETFPLYYNVVQWFPHPYWGLRGMTDCFIFFTPGKEKLVDSVFKGRERGRGKERNLFGTHQCYYEISSSNPHDSYQLLSPGWPEDKAHYNYVGKTGML